MSDKLNCTELLESTIKKKLGIVLLKHLHKT